MYAFVGCEWCSVSVCDGHVKDAFMVCKILLECIKVVFMCLVEVSNFEKPSFDVVYVYMP